MNKKTEIADKKIKELFHIAQTALDKAYAPYSKFRVGAALLCEDGSIYTGVNVENAAYSVSNCAERTALFKAVSDGHRQFKAIAVAACEEDRGLESGLPAGPVEGKAGRSRLAWPCGVCRQALVEFSPDMTVIVGRSMEDIQLATLKDLLLNHFDF